MSPEILNKKYNEKADVWALGITMYFMLTGNRPFDAKTIKELFKMISTKKLKYLSIKNKFNCLFLLN